MKKKKSDLKDLLILVCLLFASFTALIMFALLIGVLSEFTPIWGYALTAFDFAVDLLPLAVLGLIFMWFYEKYK